MRCPTCGNPNRPEARFCDSCGARLEAPEPVAEPVAVAADAPPADAPETIAGRYRVEGFLGRGGRKRVYRARDVEGGEREVAVAVYDTEDVAETVLARARREARAMLKLGEHPHIVRVLDSGEDGGVPFIVSEYVGGGDLQGTLDDCAGRQLDVEQAVAIAMDMCRALEHAHSRGIIHRDLKPANVWLGDDGAARLGDFGLATDRSSRAAVEGMLVGTVAYLPPEQALGRSSDARSDLYSLGAMLYELLTGEPPFPGEDAVAIIGRHLSAQPVAPSKHRPEVPAALDRVVLDLLSKSPDGRPASAAEARRALAAAAEDVGRAEPGEESSNPLEALARGVFVGRDAELEEMRGLLEDALAGQGRLLLLSGDPGIGKTRTADQLSTYARVRGARVYSGRCHEGDGQPPYWPWAEALRGYVLDADPVGLRWQLGSRAADVAQIVPELAERLGDVGEPPDMGTEQARFRIFDSFAAFLAGASGARPLMLVLDDLHWADEPSLLLLRFVARRLADTGLLLIGAYRDVELGRHHPLAETLGDLAGVDGTRRIALHGLEPKGIADYIELTAGVDRPPPDLADAIRDQTGGNPFFIGEVVRLMAAEGRLGEADGRREVTIPQGVREVIGRRLDRLSEAANEVLRIAAVCGREFRLDVLDRVCDRPLPEIEAALREAVANRLVDESAERPGRFAFYHALVRETLQAEVPAARRVRLHKRIAKALESVYEGELDDHLGELAHHFLEAGPLGDVGCAVDYATRAADAAEGRLAYEDAALLYAKAIDALELAPEPNAEPRLALLLKLGEAQTRASRVAHARRSFERAAALARELDRPEDMARATLGICQLSYAGIVDEPLIDLLRRRCGHRPSKTAALRSTCSAGSRRSSTGSTPRTLQRPRRGGARDGPPGRGSERPRGGARPRQFTGVVGPHQCPAGLPRPTRCTTRQAHERPRAGAARPPLPARRPPELGDIPGVDADLAAVDRLATELRQPNGSGTCLGSGDAGPRRRALRRGRRARRAALALGTRAEEPVAAQFHATQMALLRRLRRSPEDDAELDALAGPAGAGRAVTRRSRLGGAHWPRPTPSSATRARPGRSSRRSPHRTSPTSRRTPSGRSRCACWPRSHLPRRRHAGARLYELLLPYDGLAVIAGRAAASTARSPASWGCSRRRRAAPTTPSATSATPSR